MYSSETLPTAPRARGSNARETAQIVVELLRAGLEALDTNREAATRHLSKARLILETAGPFLFDRAAGGVRPRRPAPLQGGRPEGLNAKKNHKPPTPKAKTSPVHPGPSQRQPSS